MDLKYKMLDHPFYQAWLDGKVKVETLAKYGKSYTDLIRLIPIYWQKVIDHFNAKEKTYEKIVEEEYWHITLWQKWTKKLPEVNEYPKLNKLIEQLNNLNPSELLGAIFAFETQQPQIAKVKKECLIKYYGFDEKDLQYFDEHMQEDEHIAFGKALSLVYAHQEEFKSGIEKGSKALYESLDIFLDKN